MNPSKTCLVTGANGHLGQHVCEVLLTRGYHVIAGVRQLPTQSSKLSSKLASLENLNHQRFDMLDTGLVNQAVKQADLVIHCAAVFKHWARKPQQEIVEPNIIGTENIVRACDKYKIEKLIHVSSVAAVGHINGRYLDETHWNREINNAYYHSKIESEKRAWRLAEELNVPLTCVLPSAMIGPADGRFTDTMNFLNDIFHRRLPIDPNFHFNLVDVRDVASGIVDSLERSTSGERYILANDQCSTLNDIVNAAERHGYRLKRPRKIGKTSLTILAYLSELLAQLTRKPSSLTRSQVELFYGIKQNYTIDKARRELGFSPRSPSQAIIETFDFFNELQST